MGDGVVAGRGGMGPGRARVELAIAMATVGASAVLGKQAGEEIPVAVASALRFGLAAPILVVLALRAAGGWPRTTPRDLRVMLVQSLAGVVGFALFWMHGLRLTGAAEAGIVASTTPAFVAVASWVLLRSRPGARQLAGIALAVVGVAVVAAGTRADPAAASDVGNVALLGPLLILGAVVCEALFLVLGKAVGVRVPPMTLAATVTVYGFVLFAPLAVLEWRAFDPAAVSSGAWLAVVLYALGPTALGYALAYRALEVLPATTVGVFGAVVPVVAVLSAALVLGEQPGPAHAIGMALVLAAILIDVRPLRPSGDAAGARRDARRLTAA